MSQIAKAFTEYDQLFDKNGQPNPLFACGGSDDRRRAVPAVRVSLHAARILLQLSLRASKVYRRRMRTGDGRMFGKRLAFRIVFIPNTPPSPVHRCIAVADDRITFRAAVPAPGTVAGCRWRSLRSLLPVSNLGIRPGRLAHALRFAKRRLRPSQRGRLRKAPISPLPLPSRIGTTRLPAFWN